ncbi:MAG: glycosyltransferase [Nitrospira sp.]|nr:glycosyltransferase [Nitrospira sp.]
MPDLKSDKESLHVLMVTNYVEAKKRSPWFGIFVDRQVASLKQAGVRISTFDIGASHSPIDVLSKWFELRREVRRVAPDLVHGQYGSVVGIVAASAGKPTVVSYCGSDLLRGSAVSLRKLFSILLSNIAALRADGLICKSEQLRQALWWRKNRAVVIPNGIDFNLFVPGPQREAREKLGWNQESPIDIVNAGDDAKRKGIDLAQASMRVVRSYLPNAELIVISNVDPARMPLFYQAADVALCCSIAEGSPNMVKEALACNLPVVSTPVGDVPERLTGVYPSSIVSRDPKEFGKAIVNILRTRQRSNGREKVIHLSLEEAAHRILTMYRSVLREGSGNSGSIVASVKPSSWLF